MTRLIAMSVVLLTLSPALAQYERYELGRRLRAFEQAWEAQPDAVARKRALAIVPDATTNFFGLKLGEAGRVLDDSRFALESKDKPGEDVRWITSLAMRPAVRLVDTDAKMLEVTVGPFYKLKVEKPAHAKVTLRIDDGPTVTVAFDKLPVKVQVPFPELKHNADATLTLTTSLGEKWNKAVSMPIGRITQWERRVSAMKEFANTTSNATVKATLLDRAELFKDLAEGTVPETDYPISKLFQDTEVLMGSKNHGANQGVGGSGPAVPKGSQYWLTLALDKKQTAPVRLWVPTGLAKDKPVPVVVALHGAGGSENMFFDTYGAGQIVKECEARGWLLVATRSGFQFTGALPIPEVLSELAKTYPFDDKRVFLVGHSMGAGQVAELIQAKPGAYTAAAMLGGGGRVRKSSAFENLPLFIGVGDHDFARSGSLGTKTVLEKAGVKGFIYKEYPDVEHLVIVREALPEVFKMFDLACKK